jgi:hypothetical protein
MQSLCDGIKQQHAGLHELTIIYVPAEIIKKNLHFNTVGNT